MKYTTNYNLKKPDQDDFYNIEDLNSNAEVIDTELKSIDEKVNVTEQRANAYTDQEVETLTQETTQAIDTVNQRITSHKADLSNKTDEAKGASLIGIKPITGLTGDNVRSAIQNLFQYANDGKTVVANAVTAKGVTASPSDTFPTLANKIGQIQTDKTGDATAVAGDIIVGKTAYAKGAKLTGTMVNRGAITNTITTQNGQYTIPQGYHSGAGKVTATFANLIAGNVKSGVNIGSVTGNFVGGWEYVAHNIDITSGEVYGWKSFTLTIPKGTIQDIRLILVSWDRVTSYRKTSSTQWTGYNAGNLTSFYNPNADYMYNTVFAGSGSYSSSITMKGVLTSGSNFILEFQAQVGMNADYMVYEGAYIEVFYI